MKRFSKGFNIIPILFTGFLFLFVSCHKEPIPPPEPTPTEKARNELYNIMQDWYLWYDEMPDVNVDNYDSPEALLEALRYKPLDKWSFVADKSVFESYFQAGEYLGFGYGYSYDEQGNIYVTFVFKDSPLYGYGVRRGWRITAVDDQILSPFEDISPLMGKDEAGIQKKLTFVEPDSSTASFTVTKDTIRINAVLACDTLHVDDKIVGHLVFQTFVETAIAELDSAFQYLQSVGASELIVDLRYNGGGSMDVADKLASLIAGTSNKDNVFIRLIHNDKQTAYNTDIKLTGENDALSLNRVVFITSKGSASASEAVINGLKPYMNVSLIGDRTYGKPVGMHSWASHYSDYVFVPISFKLVNVNDYGDYYDGLPADDYAPDGLSYGFNDRHEPRLHDAILYLETGVYPNPGQQKSLTLLPVWKGLRAEIGAL